MHKNSKYAAGMKEHSSSAELALKVVRFVWILRKCIFIKRL
ncbi:hypothetical protein M5D96_004231, partial [Drosophila gunungcola]